MLVLWSLGMALPLFRLLDGNVIGALLTEMVCVPLVIPYQRWVCNYGIWNRCSGYKPEDVIQHGRLEPGKMFLLTWMKGVLLKMMIKNAIVTKRP
jgi:glutamate synthase (ferredoxin)